MKRTVVGAAFAALFFISSEPAAAQPAPASAASPSPRQLDLARQLVVATGMGTTMGGMMHNMLGQLAASTNKSLAGEAQVKAQIIQQAEEHMFDKLVPKIVEMVQNGYALTFSEQELSDLLAFYQSPVGRTVVAKTPQMMQGVMGDMLGLMPQMRREMGEEICAKTTCTPAQKAAFFGAAAPAKD